MNIYSNTDCHLSVLGDQPYPAFELRNIVRFLDDNEEYENMQVASSMKEWLKSPAFAQDRSLMRKRPIVWPGDRPPLPNFRRLDQSMDAAWGRGKYRREIWEDDVNPIVDWTVSFEPSEEEIDALFGPKPFWFNGKSLSMALL